MRKRGQPDRLRSLSRAVDRARAAFDEAPGVISGLTPAERAWRERAVDVAIAALAAAEERCHLDPAWATTHRQLHRELMERLRARPVPSQAVAADALTGLRPGDTARIEVTLERATPQELAALGALVRALPAGAVRVEAAARLRGA